MREGGRHAAGAGQGHGHTDLELSSHGNSVSASADLLIYFRCVRLHVCMQFNRTFYGVLMTTVHGNVTFRCTALSVYSLVLAGR